MSEVEQRRRDLKGSDPELYEYIRRMESAKAFDSAGDTVSGYCEHRAANYLWGRAARQANATSSTPTEQDTDSN